MPNVTYLVNEHTKKKYRVLGLNKETKEITLQGEFGKFTEKYDKETFKQLGYTLVQEREEETEDA